MLEEIDLSSIQDENARQLVARLLNLIEALSADLRDAQAEIQRLRDENNRLKGEVHREQTLTVDKASLLADAEFKGYEDVVVQDVVFRADNVRFHKEKYWAFSTGETYLAPLPRGYEGQFGPGLKALTLTLYFGGNISEPKILDLYANIGVQISAGQLSTRRGFTPRRRRCARQGWRAGRGSTPTKPACGSTARNSTATSCATRCTPSTPPLRARAG
jgi:hypothetical protein